MLRFHGVLVNQAHDARAEGLLTDVVRAQRSQFFKNEQRVLKGRVREVLRKVMEHLGEELLDFNRGLLSLCLLVAAKGVSQHKVQELQHGLGRRIAFHEL